MEILIQNHTIERYVEYYSPGLPDAEVHALLREMLQRAVKTKLKSACGDFVWICDGVRFVIKHDHGMRTMKRGQRKHLNKRTYCVTILPPETLVEEYETDELD